MSSRRKRSNQRTVEQPNDQRRARPHGFASSIASGCSVMIATNEASEC